MLDFASSAVAGAVLGAAAGVFFKDVVLNWYQRPQLQITRADSIDDVPGSTIFRVEVANRGRSTARECVAQMSVAPLPPATIWVGGDVTPAAYASGASSLAGVHAYWSAPSTPWQMAIHQGFTQHVQIVRCKSSGPMDRSEFTIQTDVGYEDPLIVFSSPGLAFSLKIGADNASYVAMSGYVRWGEQGPTIELTTETLPELAPLIPAAGASGRGPA
jgi:hypothetical protein